MAQGPIFQVNFTSKTGLQDFPSRTMALSIIDTNVFIYRFVAL